MDFILLQMQDVLSTRLDIFSNRSNPSVFGSKNGVGYVYTLFLYQTMRLSLFRNNDTLYIKEAKMVIKFCMISIKYQLLFLILF